MADAKVDAADGRADASAGKSPELPDTKWGRALALILIVVTAVSALFVGWQSVTNELHLNSPLTRAVKIGIPVAGALVVLVLSVRGFFGKYSKYVVYVLAAVIPLFIIGCVALIITHDEIDLTPDQPVHDELGVGAEAEHRFEIGAGDRAILRLLPSAGLKANLSVEQSGEVFDATPGTAGQRLVVDETLSGGTWTVTVQSLEGSEGSYRLTLAVDDDGQELHAGETLDEQRLVEKTDTNGYVVHGGAAPQRVLLSVDPISSGLVLQGRVVVDHFTYGQADNTTSAIAIPVDMKPKKDYVVIVRSPNSQMGAYRIQLQSDAAVPADQAATTTSVVRVPETGGNQQQLAAVPNVYGVTLDAAEQQLIAAGFPVRSFAVCSSSVGAGIVRQVITESGAQPVTIIDKPGLPARGQAPQGSRLIIKVGTGRAC